MEKSKVKSAPGEQEDETIVKQTHLYKFFPLPFKIAISLLHPLAMTLLHKIMKGLTYHLC